MKQDNQISGDIACCVYNRYKKTIICQEVAKAKNVCQVCLLDLDYNIPVQARDTALGVEDEILPDSDVGKEFKLKQLENEGQLASSYLKVCPTKKRSGCLNAMQSCAV